MASTVLLTLLVPLLLLAGDPAPARASDPGAERRLVALLNDERAERGLHPLRVAGDLRDVARRHSRRMADEGRLYHNPDYRSEVGGWQRIGENVGTAASAAAAHAAFMGSGGHRENLLAHGFTEVGVGVEVRGGDLWVTQVFRLPRGERPPPRNRTGEADDATGPEPQPHRHEHTHAPSPEPAAEPRGMRLPLAFARVEAADSGTAVAELVSALGLPVLR